MCDRVGVLYAGELVEEGRAREVFNNPRHPYTVGLLRCIPRRDTVKARHALDTIPGSLPPPGIAPDGCIFADRCGLVEERCRTEDPPLYDAGPNRRSRCHFHERAQTLPRVVPPEPEAVPGERPDHGGVLIKRGRRVEDLPYGGRDDLRARRRVRGATRRRDPGARRRVGKRQDHSGAGAARPDRSRQGVGDHAGRRGSLRDCGAPDARAGEGAPDRVPEPGFSAEPPALGPAPASHGRCHSSAAITARP